ncbi:hypothetical protein OESDEN_05767 [Oesophagostomum dentatum]|uniref:Uncharacterized protein n=1 Tax=Oesophagostomum dentatum TaxID=61180 RepID=A0A0B1T9R9_OESDE|nr:hypothetical protein OESDEN_05767 [Oesophagostomum dentatum]
MHEKSTSNLYELESPGIKLKKDSAGFPFLDNVSQLKDSFNVEVKRLQAFHRTLQAEPKKCACTTKPC